MIESHPYPTSEDYLIQLPILLTNYATVIYSLCDGPVPPYFVIQLIQLYEWGWV